MATPLAILLAARDLTRDELARRADCSPAWIGELVKGRRRPSEDLARRVATVLEIDDPADIFGDDTDAIVVSFVRRTTAASGVPEKLEDEGTTEQVATVLRDRRVS